MDAPLNITSSLSRRSSLCVKQLHDAVFPTPFLYGTFDTRAHAAPTLVDSFDRRPAARIDRTETRRRPHRFARRESAVCVCGKSMASINSGIEQQRLCVCARAPVFRVDIDFVEARVERCIYSERRVYIAGGHGDNNVEGGGTTLGASRALVHQLRDRCRLYSEPYCI